MSYHLTVDTIAARLHREGWSVGDIAVKHDGGWVWVVSGQLDGRWLAVEGSSQVEAWGQFSAQARSLQSAGAR